MNKIIISAICISFLLLISCHKDKSYNKNINEEENDDDVKRRWEKFRVVCLSECKKINKNAVILKDTKRYECDYELIDVLGLGGFGFEVSFDDVCPAAYNERIEEQKKLYPSGPIKR